jgi:hypothetical protein
MHAAPSTIFVCQLLPEQHLFENTYQAVIAIMLATVGIPYKTI